MDDVGGLWDALAAAPEVFWALLVGTIVVQIVIWWAGKPARERLRRLTGHDKGKPG